MPPEMTRAAVKLSFATECFYDRLLPAILFCSERSDFIILSRAKHERSLLTPRGLSQL